MSSPQSKTNEKSGRFFIALTIGLGVFMLLCFSAVPIFKYATRRGVEKFRVLVNEDLREAHDGLKKQAFTHERFFDGMDQWVKALQDKAAMSNASEANSPLTFDAKTSKVLVVLFSKPASQLDRDKSEKNYRYVYPSWPLPERWKEEQFSWIETELRGGTVEYEGVSRIGGTSPLETIAKIEGERFMVLHGMHRGQGGLQLDKGAYDRGYCLLDIEDTLQSQVDWPGSPERSFSRHFGIVLNDPFVTAVKTFPIVLLVDCEQEVTETYDYGHTSENAPIARGIDLKVKVYRTTMQVRVFDQRQNGVVIQKKFIGKGEPPPHVLTHEALSIYQATGLPQAWKQVMKWLNS